MKKQAKTLQPLFHPRKPKQSIWTFGPVCSVVVLHISWRFTESGCSYTPASRSYFTTSIRAAPSAKKEIPSAV